jgi:hypothetical protein
MAKKRIYTCICGVYFWARRRILQDAGARCPGCGKKCYPRSM